jgi:DNA-binding response OmpR family regulator
MPDSCRHSNTLERGDLKMDKERRVSYWKGKRLLNDHGHDLSRSCFEIVWALAKDPGAVQSSDELTKIGYVGSLDDAILTINKAFRRIDPDFDAIQNVRGVGYVFMS